MAIEPGLSGPHLVGAFLCEKVLYERDGVPTFVRVVERFNMPVLPQLPPGVQPPPGMFPSTTIQLFLVIMVKAGSLGGGKHNMKVALNLPSGSQMFSIPFQVFFNGGDDNGVMTVSPIVIPNPEEGLYWFDVYFEEMLMTRIPMRVLHQQMQQVPFPR